MISEQKFKLGERVSTPGALEAIAAAGDMEIEYLRRHSTGDWGDLSANDKRLNDQAVKDGDRILSAYTLSTGVKIWIITEWDRSVTTTLLPDEY